MNITIDKAVLEQALEALNHGITEMNHRGCAIECMPLHHATKALREALAHPQPVQQEQASRTNCGGCANADSWGLPDKAICKSCVGGNHWQPLNKSSVNPNTAQPVQEPVVWLPIETAPKDSSMLRLLVNFDDHSLEDCSEPCWTIGTNALSDTGVDEWLFAGWDWTHDRFTQGTGTPIGWLPMLYTSPQAAQPLSNADGLQISRALHQHGLTLVRTVQGFGVMKLGEITAYAATKGTT